MPGPTGPTSEAEIVICEVALRTALAKKMADTTSAIWKSPAQDHYRWPRSLPVAFMCDLEEGDGLLLVERLSDLPVELLYGCCWNPGSGSNTEVWVDEGSGQTAPVRVSVSTTWIDPTHAEAAVGIGYTHGGGEFFGYSAFHDSGNWCVVACTYGVIN